MLDSGRSSGSLRAATRPLFRRRNTEASNLTLELKIYLILAALILVQSVAALIDGYRFLRYVRRSLRRQPGIYHPPASVIVPVKGLEPGFEENLASFLNQDYPRYQLIFVVASRNDPAYDWLRQRVEDGAATRPSYSPQATLVVAGYSEERGEKVNNLLAGLAAVRAETEVLAFADADARPGRDWLRSLVAPLEDARVTVSSGYRWYLPGPGFASQLRAAWDTSIATMLGESRENFAWGGSMALRVADFKRLAIAERFWAHTVSDDYAVTRAVRGAHGWIRFEPRCLLASRGELSFREFRSWTNRQIIITRVYAARLWVLGLASYLLYCGTLLGGLALLATPGLAGAGRLGVAAFLAAILLFAILKARLRTVVARELFPQERELLAHNGARYWQLAPLVPWVMLSNFVAAGLTRRIEWSGTVYDLKSAERVVVHRRKS